MEAQRLVYVLTTNCDDSYADMALVSMLSVNLSNPDIKTLLLVDAESLAALERRNHKILELKAAIMAVDTPPGSPVFRSRWMKTQVGQFVRGDIIYLDVDTLVRRPLEAQSQFEAVFGAVADAPGLKPSEDPERLRISRMIGWNPGHTYFNSGFFYYRSSPAVDRFFEKWHSLWYDTRSATNGKDQPAFNAAITLADFDVQELAETFNHQIPLSWINCQQSKVWHFWESSRMSDDILDELTRLSADLPMDRLRTKVGRAIEKSTPAANSNRLAAALEILSVDAGWQRKLLIQKSRLSQREFLRWTLRRLSGRSASP